MGSTFRCATYLRPMYTLLYIHLLLLTLDTLLDSTSTEGQGLDLPGSLLVSVRTFHMTYATHKGCCHHDGLRSMPIRVIALDERQVYYRPYTLFSQATLQTKNFPEIFFDQKWNHFRFLVSGGLIPHSLGLTLPSLCVMFTKSFLYLSE